MSIQAISWALKQRIAKSSEKFVLVVLCNYADEQGICYPSITALCADTGQNRKTVIANLKSLTASGRIRDTGRRAGSTGQIVVYQINSTDNGSVEESQNRNSSENGTVPFFPPKSTVFSTKESQKRDTDPSRNHKGTVNRAESNIELHETLPRDTWEEWIAHRRERRWPLSPRALKPQLKLLAKYDTETQREIIETSMQAGWQGLFPPKGKKPNGGGGWQ
ncbi:MAG TPA: helix-turn-helix domain-containing protein [Steroidobacter sp.]